MICHNTDLITDGMNERMERKSFKNFGIFCIEGNPFENRYKEGTSVKMKLKMKK